MNEPVVVPAVSAEWLPPVAPWLLSPSHPPPDTPLSLSPPPPCTTAQVNAAFDSRLYWALFVVVAILEPSAGGVIFKALLRFGGTIAGGALGLGE